MVYADGRTYEGLWEAGLRHGQGAEKTPLGEIVYSGIWFNDQPISQLDTKTNENSFF